MDNKELMATIGDIIDMPLEEFEKQLVEQQCNLGCVNNIILLLQSTYHELSDRRRILIKQLEEETCEDVEKTFNAVEGVYAELIKTEQKITYLSQRRDVLLQLDPVVTNS